MASRGHCLTCTILDGCYFLEDKKPEIPLHLNCDCRNINTDYRKVQKNASAEISILKLTNYVFAGKQKSRGK